MRARGEEVRIDDTPEVLTKRLASYRALTEPLIHYYSERRKLLTVDGMMTIEHVTREINRILAAIGAVESQGRPCGRAGQAQRQSAGKGTDKRTDKTARKAARSPKSAAKPGRALKRPPKALNGRPGRPASGLPGAAKKAVKMASKRPAKKVTKKRAKA